MQKTTAAQEKEKMGPPVGVPLSGEQRERMQSFIDAYAPGLPEGRLLRLAWLFFEHEVRAKGPVYVLGQVMGV